MKIILKTLIFILAPVLVTFGQVFENTNGLIDFSTNIYSCFDFDIDSQGNTYATFISDSQMSFPTGVEPGTGNVKLVKQDSQGNVLWSSATGNNSYISHIMVDDEDNLIVTGYNNTGFFPSYIDPNSELNFRYFIAKMAPDGTFIWAKKMAGETFLERYYNSSIGFACIGNQFNSTGNATIADSTFPINVERLIYGVIDSSGSLLWKNMSEDISFLNNFSINSFSIKSDRMFLNGFFKGTVDFGNGLSLSLVNTCNGVTDYRDSYFLKISMVSKEPVSVEKFEQLMVTDMAFDEQNNIYMSVQHFYSTVCDYDGVIQGNIIPDPQMLDAYLIKLDNQGNYLDYYDFFGVSTSASGRVNAGSLIYTDGKLLMSCVVMPSLWQDVYVTPGGVNYAGPDRMFLFGLDTDLNYLYHTTWLSDYYLSTSSMPIPKMQLECKNGRVAGAFESLAPQTTTFTHDFFIGHYKVNANVISGRCFKDFNQNGIFDGIDAPVSGSIISCNPNSLLSVTDTNGLYTFFVDSGIYDLSMNYNPPYFTQSPSTATIDVSGVNINNITDFRLLPIPGGHDLSVDFIPIDPVVVGETSVNKVVIVNQGTFPETFSINWSLLNFTEPFTSVTSSIPFSGSGNNRTTTISNLSPGDSVIFFINYEVGLGFIGILNETAITSIQLITTDPDETPVDNNASFYQTVLASYDPNLKESNKPRFMDINEINNWEYLSYTVHFQNEGNYFAKNVRIEDTINQNDLVLNSFQLVDFSDPVKVRIEGNIIKFYFDSIFLPASANDYEGSKGYVHFKLKKRNDLVLGDTISNSASIFFDHNPPILTNRMDNVIYQPIASIDDLEVSKVLIYPNPTREKLMVKNAAGMNIQVFDVKGTSVNFSFQNVGESVIIDLDSVENGIYLLVVNNQVVRFVVENN